MSQFLRDFLPTLTLTAKSLHQGYQNHKRQNLLSKFHRRHYESVSKFNAGLKSLLQQGLSEPELYGDLFYGLKTNMSRADISDQFRKVIIRYKRIGYDINVTQQSAC